MHKIKFISTISLLLLLCSGMLYSANDVINVEKNRVESIKLPKGFSEIFIVNSAIADVKMGKGDTLYVYGKKAGITNLSLSNSKGEEAKFTVVVSQNLEQLRLAIKEFYPDEDIKITSSAKGIILSGAVSSSKVVRDIEGIVAHNSEGAPGDILNQLTISTSTQVILKVKVAEVNRSLTNTLNLNTSDNLTSLNGFTFGLFGGSLPFQAATPGISGSQFVRSPGETGGAVIQFTKGKKDLTSYIDAISSEALGTILAEPTLVALSGETASFLAGGEFPILIPQTGSAGTAPTITVEFKEYGVRLSFTPTVISPNLINLRVSPEVSTIDKSVQIEIAGTIVPGLKTRKAETSVEMASGQSLAMAGLLSNSITSTISDNPMLANIPVLGALFRSTDFESQRTELIITVTPYINTPTNPNNIKSPTEGLKHANTLEMLFLEKLNTNYKADPNNPGTIKGLLGTAGFSTE